MQELLFCNFVLIDIDSRKHRLNAHVVSKFKNTIHFFRINIAWRAVENCFAGKIYTF